MAAPAKPPTFFIAGIIQGSRVGADLHAQDYRRAIRTALEQAFPGADIFDPVERYPGSGTYDEARADRALRHLFREAAARDVLVAFVPEASMGTAIEVWEAHRAARLVIAITPLRDNWVLRACADRLVPDLASFERFVLDGELGRLVEARAPGPDRPARPARSG